MAKMVTINTEKHGAVTLPRYFKTHVPGTNWYFCRITQDERVQYIWPLTQAVCCAGADDLLPLEIKNAVPITRKVWCEALDEVLAATRKELLRK